jgi:hypothetical protein
VRKPAPGKWTAALWTLKNTSVNLGQYTGDVRFSYFTQRFQSSGSVTPAVQTLAPGQTATIALTLPASAQSGDRAAALRLSSGAPDDGAVPIVVRSLLALGPTGGSFQGALTGGGTPGQQFTYQFDVPAAKPSLNLALGLRDAHHPLVGYLVDPYGQPLGVQSTATSQTASGTTIYGNTMQFFRRTPSAGRWTIVVSLDQRLDAIDGQFFTEPFNGSIGFDVVPVAASGLPNADSTVIPRGQTATATIQVTNSGNSRKDFFVDPRLNQLTFQQILGYQATGVGLPLSLAQQPYFYIPPGSDQAYVAAQGTVPVVMDVLASSGQPDILASALPDNQVIAVFGAPELAPSRWFALPEAKGPFTSRLVGARADVAALVETNVFDSTVSSSTGNAWEQLAINNFAPYTPLTLPPGQSGSITVRITPNAPRGTVVHGLLGIDTMNPFTTSGDEIVVLPYAYTVG